jgi:hypothetical protein
MSRCLTLEEYLQDFVDENKETAGDDTRLLVTNQQAQMLGFFFIHGLTGFIESVRLQRSHIELEETLSGESEERDDPDACNEFIN